MLRNNAVCRRDAYISSLVYLWSHVSCNAMQGTWRSTRDMRGKMYIFFSIKVEIGIFVVE